jgi:hypothetical protein
MTPLGIRVRSVGALSLASVLILGAGVPAAAQLSVEEFCATITAEPGAEGASSSPAVDAAASPAVDAAASPAMEAAASPATDVAASPPAEGSAMSEMSPETTALLVELCMRAGLGTAASSGGEASAAPMESPAASIAAEASPATG